MKIPKPMTEEEAVTQRWRRIGVWLALTWRWLSGGPKLIRELAGVALNEQRKRQAAEERERETLRETFKRWHLSVRADDGQVVHIRPGKMTVHIEGAFSNEVYSSLKEAWKSSSLLMRFPFPLDQRGTPQGDWRLSVMPVTFVEE